MTVLRAETTAADARPPRAFYMLGDASYFLGIVALVNSLRLLEHTEPIFVLDCGFTEPQRNLLSAEATVVSPPEPVFPPLAKAVAPLLHPARQMVLIDSDVIVLRRLSPLLEQATEDRVVAFADPVSHRYDPRWSRLLGLPEQQRHPYVNAGFLVLSDASLPVLQEFDELCRRVNPQNSVFRSGSPSDPFYYVDQDILNALLGTRFRHDQLIIHEQRLAPHPPFRGLDADATQPFLLHYVHRRKPWLAHTRSSVFSRRLARLLVAPDLALTPPIDSVPWRLRTGARASLARVYSGLRGRAADNRGRLGIRRRLDTRRLAKKRGTYAMIEQSRIDERGA